MVTEHALLHVVEGREAGFETAMGDALAVIESAPGCHGARVSRQVEDRSVYLLLVHWDSVAAHEEFRTSDLYETWRTLTHPWYVERPQVTHFDEAIERS